MPLPLRALATDAIALARLAAPALLVAVALTVAPPLVFGTLVEGGFLATGDGGRALLALWGLVGGALALLVLPAVIHDAVLDRPRPLHRVIVALLPSLPPVVALLVVWGLAHLALAAVHYLAVKLLGPLAALGALAAGLAPLTGVHLVGTLLALALLLLLLSWLPVVLLVPVALATGRSRHPLAALRLSLRRTRGHRRTLALRLIAPLLALIVAAQLLVAAVVDRIPATVAPETTMLLSLGGSLLTLGVGLPLTAALLVALDDLLPDA